MWKLLYDSVQGTSHRLSGAVCQDHAYGSPFKHDTEEGIVLTCSDGAGSAAHSEVGSKLACETAVRTVMDYLESGRMVGEADETTLRGWAKAVNDALLAEANQRGVTPRDLACTLLVAVIGRAAAAFVQVGDGAIIILDGNTYRPVFWPQTGEYQNTTFFISEPRFDQNVQHTVLQQEVAELALFSDGLQMLALNYATKSAHQPFFAPMFASLRKVEDAQELLVPLKQFLDSEAVNNRTDDDKTLVLATRVAANGDAAV